jgi:hypothetical protein
MIDISETIGATLRILLDSYGWLPISRGAAACLPHCSDILGCGGSVRTGGANCSTSITECLRRSRTTKPMLGIRFAMVLPLLMPRPSIAEETSGNGGRLLSIIAAQVEKPPLTAEFNAPDALRTYLEPGNDVVSITIYRCADCRAVPAQHVLSTTN